MQPVPHAPPRDSGAETLRASLWMLGAVVSFTSMALAGRAVSLELDTFEIMTWRSLTGIVIVLAVGTMAGTLRQVSTERLGLHTIRNMAHFTGQNLWFYAIATIPLAQVFALEFTSPIWALLLAPLILSEPITRRAAIVAAIGFAGILVVARPSPETLSPGLVAAAGAALGFGLTAVLTRRLTRSDSITSILFWLTVMQAVFGLVCAGIDGDIALPSAEALPFVIVVGCAGLAAHFCLTTALSLAPASIVMPIDFLRLPLITLLGMALYAEIFDPWVLLGGALIFAANYVNIVLARRDAKM
ncbi:DMT family transporter [Histidinibacterium aquaticum]|uniref:DMT family transporter n=1 Tax=Histidinibacterium aquaticum TaxID=2613962 RepID=A0A5J5GNS3_9RHOB|nr:DMT family transporter [Histidinibacterium aquaticum]KAA9009218.1 DMT family transporter [Histidinibacterium aquaticum]